MADDDLTPAPKPKKRASQSAASSVVDPTPLPSNPLIEKMAERIVVTLNISRNDDFKDLVKVYGPFERQDAVWRGLTVDQRTRWHAICDVLDLSPNREDWLIALAHAQVTLAS